MVLLGVAQNFNAAAGGSDCPYPSRPGSLGGSLNTAVDTLDPGLTRPETDRLPLRQPSRIPLAVA